GAALQQMANAEQFEHVRNLGAVMALVPGEPAAEEQVLVDGEMREQPRSRAQAGAGRTAGSAGR
ncbi:hypothetical protein, partial [Lysobacter sp. TAB13]|uniref:hypothetical protein n=1 Tax=Lysobacter sp. TAB13 TaxID=3233065 RepID=UPI003F96587D